MISREILSIGAEIITIKTPHVTRIPVNATFTVVADGTDNYFWAVREGDPDRTWRRFKVKDQNKRWKLK